MPANDAPDEVTFVIALATILGLAILATKVMPRLTQKASAHAVKPCAPQ